MKAALVIVLWLLTSSLALAQDTRVPVAVAYYGDDEVGLLVASTLKAAFLESMSFRLVEDEPTPSFPRMVVYLVSVQISTDASAIAQSFVYDSPQSGNHGNYIATAATACGENRVALCVKTILSYTDNAVEYLRKNFPDLWRNLTAPLVMSQVTE